MDAVQIVVQGFEDTGKGDRLRELLENAGFDIHHAIPPQDDLHIGTIETHIMHETEVEGEPQDVAKALKDAFPDTPLTVEIVGYNLAQE